MCVWKSKKKKKLVPSRNKGAGKEICIDSLILIYVDMLN